MEQTPKEYAKELVNDMYMVDDPMGNYPMCFDTAKQCAKISINQTLKELVEFDNTDGYAQSRIDYYTEAIKEVEKL